MIEAIHADKIVYLVISLKKRTKISTTASLAKVFQISKSKQSKARRNCQIMSPKTCGLFAECQTSSKSTAWKKIKLEREKEKLTDRSKEGKL